MDKDRVSLRDIYDAVGKLEGKIDQRFEKLESRVSALEAFQNRIFGIGAAFSAFSSLVMTFIWEKIFK